uniref:Uncharacterized protein n=1 Tax=Physcomitrium patens TaxID=3218 RepID=A9TQU0_PHYPA
MSAADHLAAMTSASYMGSAPSEDGVKPPIHESSAILLLLGSFLAAMSPLLLVPLFLTDSQGRRWIGAKIGLCIFGFGFTTILGVLTTTNWRVVAPYVGMSLEALQSAFNVAKELPGDLAEWLDSGKGFYLLIKTFVAFAVVALLCGSAFPMLQRRFNSLKVRIKGTDASLEPRSVNVNSQLLDSSFTQSKCREGGNSCFTLKAATRATRKGT